MSGFAPGDVVVCVDARPKRNDLPMPHLNIHHLLIEGRCYRVADAWVSTAGTPAVSLAGVSTPAPMRGFSAYRFRKIDPATDEFTEQMRALRPVRAPLQAGCR